MILISQNKERILWFGRAFNALEYKESVKRKEKEEEIRHTICISDGTLEEVAAYESKERCLEVLKEFCRVYENECYTVAYFDNAACATIPATYRNNVVFQFPEK